MAKYIAKRILLSLVTLFVILFILFMLLQFMPGSPFNDEKLTAAQQAVLMAKYGLDKPFFERFWIYLQNVVLRGDFGISYAIKKDMLVSGIVMSRLGTSVRIGLQALLLGTSLGVVFGVISGAKRNTWMDSLATVAAVIGVSIPSYVLALVLSFVLGYKFRIFDITYKVDQPLWSSILPTIALSFFVMAQTTRFLRTELIEVLGSDYIKLVDAKGVKRFRVIMRHGLRNALISVVTILGPLTVNLMTGSLVVERVYGIPGIGSLLVEGIQVNDYNIIVMIAFVYSALYIFVNLIVDVLYGVIDPRIRVAKGG
ncbi:MAG: ABC transporter permease [Erysipelotrichaceae bacterium]|nr:ABC transporter permease [Erysipelotrichaceae bacterium]